MGNSSFIKSSILKKYWMAATGLFLILFLLAHMVGNLQILLNDNGESFNVYASFMTSNTLIKTMSYLTYLSILFHAIDGIMLTVKNRKARSQNYKYNKPEKNSKWSSRNMALLGSIVFIFIVVHMVNFWGKMHFGEMPQTNIGDESIKDLYTVVVMFFTNESFGLAMVLFYVLAMIFLAYHLLHGFKSAFQTLGLYHTKYNCFITGFTKTFAILVPLIFAIIPIYIYIVK